MRYSNYIFTKGSIVFVKFPASSKEAYLNGRPLIVVSNPTHILKTLIVCSTGTQDKPGIEVSFWNHNDGCYVGDNVVSKIYPYSLMTIYTDDIVSSIGQLDPFIMKEVDKAIDFHLGKSDEIPGYLKDQYNYICGVSNNPIDDKYISKEHTNEHFTPHYAYRKEHRRSITSKKLPTKYSRSTLTNYQITDVDIARWVNESPDKELNLPAICKNPSELIHAIDEKSVNMIVSRIVPIALIAKKYGINQRVATFLRITLTNISVKLGVNIINGKIKSEDRSDLADYVVIGMILANAFSNDSIKSNIHLYDSIINQISHKYRINTEDRRTWRSVETFYCE